MKYTFPAIALFLSGLLLLSVLACSYTITFPEDETAVPKPTRTISHEAYIIMTLQAAPPLPAVVQPTEVASNETTDSAVAASEYDVALVTQGQQDFTSLCAACHGVDGKGLPKLGKNLVESEFVASLTDQDLMNFVKTGRPIWDPLNTTGIDMPAKGGNPALTDDQILAIIAFVRTAQ